MENYHVKLSHNYMITPPPVDLARVSMPFVTSPRTDFETYLFSLIFLHQASMRRNNCKCIFARDSNDSLLLEKTVNFT